MADKPVIFFTNLFGWSTRNFFQTGVMDQLTRHFRVVVLASPAMKRGLEQLGFDRDVEVLEHNPGPEPRLWRLIRQARKKLYMESRHSFDEALWSKYRARPWYQRIGGALFKGLVKIIPALTLYRCLERLDYRINKDASMHAIFQEYRPRFVFFTHATHFGDEIILRNALAACVPAVYMILSWDHLSTAKVLLSSKFARILVWNQHSKNEIRQTYPHIPQERVQVVGIPQYDIYAEKPPITYAQWCERYGLDPARRTVLFSTMPQARHEQQHIVLAKLSNWLEAPENRDLNLQLLIKTHPFDSFPNYTALLKPGRVGLHRTSLPAGVKAEEWIPTPDEIQASRDCLYFCSININIFSTVTIEACYFDKPVVHLAFDPLPVHNRIPCREYYNWDHFKHIVDKQATTLAESYDELFQAIREYASHPEKRRRERQTVVQAYIGKPVGTAANEVAANLVEFSAGGFQGRDSAPEPGLASVRN